MVFSNKFIGSLCIKVRYKVEDFSTVLNFFWVFKLKKCIKNVNFVDFLHVLNQ